MAERRYRKGDRVRFRFGLTDMEGVVTEDRGPLGIEGRHLYTVHFHFRYHDEEGREVDLPADEMQPVIEPVPVE